MKILSISVILLLVVLGGAPVEAVEAEHNLQVRLDPTARRIISIDQLQIRPEGAEHLEFRLSEAAENLRVELQGRSVPSERTHTRLRIVLPTHLRRHQIRVDISYEAVFDDPAPRMPLNTDNPGYGVSGTISEAGVLLLAGAGWYPHIDADTTTYRVRVEAPADWIAVTAGRSLGMETRDNRSVSSWLIDHPVRGLSLSAGRYEVRRKVIGKTTAETYFFPESSALADAYLDAVVDYIGLYEDLFGAYPFAKFAVVENFFPTGYGFPSYTLIGSRVLRLPFIISTSLGHEIAHCWWGNGVHVDYRKGNWSEGLTTYVADYLYKERRSAAAAVDYRRQILRNYASLVPPDRDFALTRFISRTDPLTKTVGYDKGAMVFHMLRRKVGEEAFWGALRDVYRESIFETVSWDGLQNAFERRSGISLQDFFDQWVRQNGAPQLAFEDIHREPTENGWRIQGRIIQDAPAFQIAGTLRVETVSGEFETTLQFSGPETSFEIASDAAPLALAFDPEFHVFRRLHPTEIPPTVNSVKGASSLRVILAEAAGSDLASVADTLQVSLGLDGVPVLREREITPEFIANHDLLWIGLPKKENRLALAGDRVTLGPSLFRLNAKSYANPEDVFFGVFEHPSRSGGIVGLFLPLSPGSAQTAARKITHYGKYSYLVFHSGRNVQKGTWPVQTSPVIHHFDS
jgi:hypothetical protein